MCGDGKKMGDGPLRMWNEKTGACRIPFKQPSDLIGIRKSGASDQRRQWDGDSCRGDREGGEGPRWVLGADAARDARVGRRCVRGPTKEMQARQNIWEGDDAVSKEG